MPELTHHPGDPRPELRRRGHGVRRRAGCTRCSQALATDRPRGAATRTIILIDCPPSLNLLTINALVAAHSVLVPLQCEFFALEGLSQLMRTVQTVRQSSNPQLKIQGIVLTMYDRRNNLSGQVAADVRENLGTLVYDTVIPRNVRLSEAPSHAVPALIYDRSSQRQPRLPAARWRAARADGRGPRPSPSRPEAEDGHGTGRVSDAGCRRCSPTSPPIDEPLPRRARPAPAPPDHGADRPDPAEPEPAAPRLRREGARGARRLDPREGRDPAADPAAAPGRARAASRSSPASAAGAPRRSPACTRCRPSCASSPTPRCSSSRSSRTSSAPI